MRRTLWFPVWLMLWVPVHGAGAPDVSERARTLFREEFKYAPASTAVAATVEARDDAALLLPAYTVSEDRLLRDIDRAVRKSARDIAAKKFNWVRGGTIKEFTIGGRKVEIGTWLDGSSLALLRLSW
jgi:hypothetical protein